MADEVKTTKDTPVPYFKNDPWVYIPFFVILGGIIVAAAMNKISVEMAGLLIGLLGFPSVAGAKKLSGIVAIIVNEVQKQMVSMPPPPNAENVMHVMGEPCMKAPSGWKCSRNVHEGPCAAYQLSDETKPPA